MTLKWYNLILVSADHADVSYDKNVRRCYCGKQQIIFDIGAVPFMRLDD